MLAEFREPYIKAATGTKVANAMAKKQGSSGEDEAVATASIAAARGAGEVVAGSAFAGEAGEVVAGCSCMGRQSNMLSGTQTQVYVRMTELAHLARSPKAGRSLLDPNLKI